jgi:predicted RNase H-like HicB family nuclease
MKQEVTYTVHIEACEEGGYVAYFPVLPGCHTQGETLEEVIGMAKDALGGYLATLKERGAPIPKETRMSKVVGFEFPLSASFAR